MAERVAEGSDYLKVFLEPGTSTGRVQPMPDDATVRALVAAGHAAGLLVVAHATDADAARRRSTPGWTAWSTSGWTGPRPSSSPPSRPRTCSSVPTLTVIDGLWGTGAGARALAARNAWRRT